MSEKITSSDIKTYDASSGEKHETMNMDRIKAYENQRKKFIKDRYDEDEEAKRLRDLDKEIDAKLAKLQKDPILNKSTEEIQAEQASQEVASEVNDIEGEANTLIDGLADIAGQSVYGEEEESLLFDPGNLLSIQGIKYETHKYSEKQMCISEYTQKIGKQYEHFVKLQNHFKILDDKYDVWDNINSLFGGELKEQYQKASKILSEKKATIKKHMDNAQKNLDDAIKDHQQTGAQLDQAPDNYMQKEQAHRGASDQEMDNQQKDLQGNIADDQSKKQSLENKKNNLTQTQQVLASYQSQLDLTKDQMSFSVQEMTQQLQLCDSSSAQYKASIDQATRDLLGFTLSDEDIVAIVETYNSDPTSLSGQYHELFKNEDFVAQLNAYTQLISQGEGLTNVITQINNGVAQITLKKEEITSYSGMLDQHNTLLSTEITGIDKNISELSTELENKEIESKQKDEYYDQNRDELDRLDAEVSGAVLDCNIANDSISASVDGFSQAIGKADFSEKGLGTQIWDGTIGMVGYGVNKAFSGLSHQLGSRNEGISDWIEKNSDNVLVKYVAQPVLGATVQMNLGLLEGASDLIGGVGMLVEKPLSCLNGMGSLIGRDPESGERSFGKAGETRLNMGKMTIAYDQFEDGQIGRGTGKAVFSIGSMILTGGIGGGVKGASVAGKFGRSAKMASYGSKTSFIGKASTVTKAGLYAGYEFGRVAAGGLANGIAKTPKNIGKFFANTWKATGRAIGNVYKNPVGVVGSGFNKMGNAIVGAKNSLASTGRTVAKQPMRALKEAAALGSGYYLYRGMRRMAKGESFFPKIFKGTNVEKFASQLSEDMAMLGKVDDAVGSSYSSLKGLIDESGNILTDVKVPRAKYAEIAKYRELLKQQRALTKRVNNNANIAKELLNTDETLGPLAKGMKSNDDFADLITNYSKNPDKLQKYIDKFNKKSKIDPETQKLFADKKILDLGDGKILSVDKSGKVLITKGKPVAIKTGADALKPGQKLTLKDQTGTEYIITKQGDEFFAAAADGSSPAVKMTLQELENAFGKKVSEIGTIAKKEIGTVAKQAIDIDINPRALKDFDSIFKDGNIIAIKVGHEFKKYLYRGNTDKGARFILKGGKRGVDQPIYVKSMKDLLNSNRFKLELGKSGTSSGRYKAIQKIIDKQKSDINKLQTHLESTQKQIASNEIKITEYKSKANLSPYEKKQLELLEDRNKYLKMDLESAKAGRMEIHSSVNTSMPEVQSPKVKSIDAPILIPDVERALLNAASMDMGLGKAIGSLWENNKGKIGKGLTEVGKKIYNMKPSPGLFTLIALNVANQGAEETKRLTKTDLIAQYQSAIDHIQSSETLSAFDHSIPEVLEILSLDDKSQIKEYVRNNKNMFKEMILQLQDDGSYIVDFSLINYMKDITSYDGMAIDEQKLNIIIKSIGLGDILPDGQQFDVEGRGSGTIVGDRSISTSGSYIPIWQGDRVTILNT